MTVAGDYNEIGGDAPGEGNVISGCIDGIDIEGDSNAIEGNRIGTDAAGTHELGNSDDGVSVAIGVSYNTIGGTTRGAGNLISGNEIGIDENQDIGTIIEGNFIGTDVTGTLALGNQAEGLELGGTSDVIGGDSPGSGNVISGNRGFGIALDVGGGCAVLGNFIGTDSTGTLPLGNGSDGIMIQTTDNVIGGSTSGAGNVISGNGGDGVHIDVPPVGDTDPGNVVQGNEIGTDIGGTEDLGDAGAGVSILGSSDLASDETIGGTDPGAGDVIAFNGGPGVDSESGPGDSIRGNDIFANGGLGIVADINGVLSTYAEARGIALPDNAPVLTSAVFDPRGTVVEGTLTGTPLTEYGIDFFASDAINAGGFGDGQTFLESISVVVDGSGSAPFQIPLDDAIPVGRWITATATDSGGNTSPFSQAMPVAAAASPDAVQLSAPAYLVTETGGAAVVVINRVGSTAGTVTVDYTTVDGSARAGTNYTAESGVLTFGDGQASQTVTIPVQDDGIATPDTSFQVVLSNPTGIGLGGVADAVVTIAEAESAGVIGFSTGAVSTPESGQPPPLVVARTGGGLGPVTVDYRITGSTGTPGVDYEDVYGTLTFADGQTTATIPITIYDNDLSAVRPDGPVFGDPQTIDVTLGNPTGGATLGPITTSVITIHGEDDAEGGFGVSENGGSDLGVPVEIEVYRTGNVAGLESVAYATGDGTGRAGVNYVAVSGTLTFQPGDTEKFVEVPILSDLPDGTASTFQFTLIDPTGGAILDEGEDRITVAANASSGAFTAAGSGDENDKTAMVAIERVGGAFRSASVAYSTSDGTAIAGVDYTPVSGTVFFPVGVEVQYITVPLLPDARVAGDINFFVALSDPTDGATVADASGLVTIRATPGTLQLSAGGYTVAENDASLTVAITLDHAPHPEQYTAGDGHRGLRDQRRHRSGRDGLRSRLGDLDVRLQS